MAHPFYEALKLAYPYSVIHFLCSENLKDFPDSNLCSEKLVLTTESKRVGSAFHKLVKQIKAEKYDLSVMLTSSFSSSLLLLSAQIPLRIGFSQSGSGIFLTDSLKWFGLRSGKHKSAIYLELLEFMTGKSWQTEHSEEPHKSVEKRIVVAPGASISLRVWPFFFELLRNLSESYPDHEIAVVGARGEQYWHGLLESFKSKNVRDYVEKTSLSELIDLCRGSALVIANDSGVGHLAGTMARVPTLVLFGPGSPQYIKPLGPKVVCQIPQGVPCHPCEKPKCHEKYGYQACLKSISLESVMDQVNELQAPVLNASLHIQRH